MHLQITRSLKHPFLVCATFAHNLENAQFRKTIPFMQLSFVRVVRFITNRKNVFFFIKLDCHLTNFTVIHWIKIDYLLLLIIMIGEMGKSV